MDANDNRAPIEPRHVDFARAVVALARLHNVRDVKMEFHGGGPGQPWTRVSAHWNAGRQRRNIQHHPARQAIHRCSEIPDIQESAHD
jgi:hypothetical protein